MHGNFGEQLHNNIWHNNVHNNFPDSTQFLPQSSPSDNHLEYQYPTVHPYRSIPSNMLESNTDPSSIINLSPGPNQPPRTREGASQRVFDKILRLNTPHQQPLALAFQLSGIASILDVMSLTLSQINQMTYRDGKGTKVQDLPTGFKSCIVVFQHYVQHVIERLGRRLTIDNWYELDEIDLCLQPKF